MKEEYKPQPIDEEDAFNFIIRYIRDGIKSKYPTYGYDLYLPNTIRSYLELVHDVPDREAERHLEALSPPFYTAAWELCRRGILRPGIKAYRRQSTEEGNAGNGYSLTLRGKDWIRESGQYDYVPIEPGRLARMLDDYAAVFGEGFSERSQEAVRCYSALAYLACCVMCGAAAESIILALAIEKTGDEASVLKEYSSSGGRGRLEISILDGTPKPIQNEFRGYTNLLKYWRDTASHGKRASIADNEAFTSLALLLRFAAFARDNWERLTT